jgi:hypothetical protein
MAARTRAYAIPVSALSGVQRARTCQASSEDICSFSAMVRFVVVSNLKNGVGIVCQGLNLTFHADEMHMWWLRQGPAAASGILNANRCERCWPVARPVLKAGRGSAVGLVMPRGTPKVGNPGQRRWVCTGRADHT